MKVDIYFVGNSSLKFTGLRQEDVHRLLDWYRRQRKNEVFEIASDEGSHYFTISQVAMIIIPK